jgi:hypothetical protein
MAGQGMVMYYVKVVPTSYASVKGELINTNQFSVTEHFRHTDTKTGQGLPGIDGTLCFALHRHAPRHATECWHAVFAGVFFFYELSPIMVRFTEQRKSFGHFITQLCAILGGVFTVAGMIDRLVFSGLRHLEKKLSINKLT